MNCSEREERIEFRIAQAQETLKEAEALLSDSLYRGAINRAYYAMFYTILALAVFKGETVSKHSGVIAFFDREFVKTGALSRELSKALHLGFERRQTNDYGEVWLVDRGEAEIAIAEARTFVDAIMDYLRTFPA